MGAKSSKSELTRRKSFSTIGRSSQRSLFQKLKVRLNRISKQIDSANAQSDAANLESIKNDLDATERELNGISDTVKAKNQEKYDEVLIHFQSTRKKYDDKFKNKLGQIEEIDEPVEDTNEIILRNAPHDTRSEAASHSEEPKKLSVSFRETSEEAVNYSEEPKRPSVKFGVQVLPPSPQNQVLLKRKTYPINSSPKNELLNRNTTDGGFPYSQNGTSPKVSVQASNSFSSRASSTSEYSATLIESNIKREYLRSNSLLGIETVNNEVNKLENKLKFFTGNKGSKSYIELQHGLLNNLTLLERIDTEEDPITNQEKKILTKRINELLKILECLVEQIHEESDEQDIPTNRTSEQQEHPRLLSPVTAI